MATAVSADSRRSPGKNGEPSTGIAAARGRSARNPANPATVPATAAVTASAAAIPLTCAGVAPARRIAASRCSRRAAPSRVAVSTSTITGTSRPARPTSTISRRNPVAARPPPVEVSMLRTVPVPGRWRS